MDYEVAPAQGQFAPQRLDDSVPPRDPWIPFFDIWYDYLLGGAEPPFSGRNNLKTFAMLSAAIESVETGKPVEIAGNPKYQAAFLN
jgi:predicted dehydrogenase